MLDLGWRLLDVQQDSPVSATLEILERLPSDADEYGERIEAILTASSFAGLSEMTLCYGARRHAQTALRDDQRRKSCLAHAGQLMAEERVNTVFPPALDYVQNVFTRLGPHAEALCALLVAAQFRGCDVDGLLLDALDHHEELRQRVSLASRKRWLRGDL